MRCRKHDILMFTPVTAAGKHTRAIRGQSGEKWKGIITFTVGEIVTKTLCISL